MQPPGAARPRVSRETRMLLTTVVVATAALWVLARFRFPDQPAPVNPVTPVLTQLAPQAAFDDLASQISELQPRILPSLVKGGQSHLIPEMGLSVTVPLLGLRVRDDIAVAWVDPGQPAGTGVPADPALVAHDEASGLTLLRVPALPRPELSSWSPRRTEAPRYIVAAEASSRGIALRPVFVPAMYPDQSPLWSEPLWAVAPDTRLPPGGFVFTMAGALAGVAVSHGRGSAVLPAAALFAEVERLLARGEQPAGWLGVEVRPMTPALAAAAGVSGGLIIASVDPHGPSAGTLAPLDVIEAADGVRLSSTQEWLARAGRLAVGQAIVLRVRRGAAVQDVRLTAAAQPPPSRLPLGLTMRTVPRLGAEVLRVEPRSAAERAGLRTGDLITAVAGTQAPTPAQIARLFGASEDGRPVAAAITRGNTHHVVALEKR